MVKSCNWPAAYNSFEIFPLSVSDRRVRSPETLSTGDIDFLKRHKSPRCNTLTVYKRAAPESYRVEETALASFLSFEKLANNVEEPARAFVVGPSPHDAIPV